MNSAISSSVWDQNIVPTTGPFVSQVHHTAVTAVPTNPTVCVASSTPVVSAVTTSSAVTIAAGPSRGPAQSGQSIHSARVVHPTSGAPPTSDHMTAEEAYFEYLRNVQNPDGQGPYYDPENHYLYTSLPEEPYVEASVPLSVAWGTTRYGGGQYHQGRSRTTIPRTTLPGSTALLAA